MTRDIVVSFELPIGRAGELSELIARAYRQSQRGKTRTYYLDIEQAKAMAAPLLAKVLAVPNLKVVIDIPVYAKTSLAMSSYKIPRSVLKFAVKANATTRVSLYRTEG
ncbi:MAG: hypothetical protein JO105_13215 [Hyphomicrobiales bacterium]|nr:hypothetical protein [Hyphomicrobiales bacterium]